MNCLEAEAYVSELCDGERIRDDAAKHIAACPMCRRMLSDYARMGAELRLAATAETTELPPLRLPGREMPFAFLWKRVAVPRFALAALVVCAIVAAAATSILRAQPKPLWFEFECSLDEGAGSNYVVAKQGFDQTASMLGIVNGQSLAAAYRVKVDSIATDDVVLRIQAEHVLTEKTATGTMLRAPTTAISLDGVAAVHYKPGTSLAVPIAGGGALYLKGDVLDHQPSIAFGMPLVPAANTLSVRSPVLLQSTSLIADMRGGSAIVDQAGQAVTISLPDSVFSFALQPFSGAVPAQANWGEISFKIDGKDYRLLAAAPVTGGDQPRTIWVRRDTPPDAAFVCPQWCIGTGPY